MTLASFSLEGSTRYAAASTSIPFLRHLPRAHASRSVLARIVPCMDSRWRQVTFSYLVLNNDGDARLPLVHISTAEDCNQMEISRHAIASIPEISDMQRNVLVRMILARDEMSEAVSEFESLVMKSLAVYPPITAPERPF